MARVEKFATSLIERVSEILGDTETGLTGSEIGKYLNRASIPDGISSTKRVRLFEALSTKQQVDGCGNCLVNFLHIVMDPVIHTSSVDWFETKRTELNKALAFAGIRLGEDGKCRLIRAATTLAEAEQRAEKLRRKLSERGVHLDVLKVCEARLLQDNYFHAVLEATKSVAEKIRSRTGLSSDGSALVDTAFGFRNQIPYLAVSRLEKDSQQSEQLGLMNLTKGIFSTFRNPTAHELEISWPVSEQDALDLLTMVSYLHRRIDAAHRTARKG